MVHATAFTNTSTNPDINEYNLGTSSTAALTEIPSIFSSLGTTSEKSLDIRHSNSRDLSQDERNVSDMLTRSIRESSRSRKSTMHEGRIGSRLSQSLAPPQIPRDSSKHINFSSDSSKQSSFPILRWFNDQPDVRFKKSEIQDALTTDIRSMANTNVDIQAPPMARLSPVIAAGRNSTFRTPNYHLGSLSRSTLPTASLSHAYEEIHVERRKSSESVANYSHSPTRTSIDSLRTIHERRINLHTSTRNSLQSNSLGDTLGRWWFKKEDLLDENDKATEGETEQEHIKRKYLSTNNPVVFCHGLLGFDSVTIGPQIAPLQVAHWRGIKEVLEANGTEVLITRVPATSSPVDRAKVLEAKVSETYPGRAVHLIGHSMGGLDCRYLTTHLKNRKFRVLSITTIASPHRGSAFADHFIATIGKERMPSVLSLLDLLPNGGGDGKAFESLTIANMQKFNEETPDVEDVQYFSWGAVFEPGLLDTFRWPHSVVLEKEGPNDGLVSVESSKWGTYLGTLEDVNHLDLVGWINTARYKWAEFTGREIKFKPATFYLGIVDHLARVVERQGEDVITPNQHHEGAEGTRAGEGVNTVEGVENRGPADDESSVTRREQ